MYTNNYISIQMLNVLCINNLFVLFRIYLYLVYCVINYDTKVNIIKNNNIDVYVNIPTSVLIIGFPGYP